VPEPSAAGTRRRRWWWVAAPAAGVAVVGALLLGPGDSAPLTVVVDRPAPPFELENLREGGPAVSLASAGGRPVVLNFWASWCRPCLAEMPVFDAVSRRVAGRVAFLGVNHRDGRNPALDLLARTKVTYPSGHDPQGRLAPAFGARGMPTTVFISAGGRVLERRTGELTEEQLEAVIDRLFPA